MMSRLENAARQALEALDQIATHVGQYDLPGMPNHITTLATLHRDALREALAEQQAAELVDKVAIMQRIVDSQTGHTRTVAREPEQQPTCKQHLQVWVIPKGKGRGQFSWEPQDERFWTRMVPSVKQSLTAQPEPAQQAAEPNAILVEGFGRVALGKLNDLREKGYAINGVSIATISEAGETQLGAVTTGGRVLWWPQQTAEPVEWPHKWGCRANAFGECNMGCTVQQPTQQPLTDDTRRLEWLMLTVSGAELRRIGVCYVNNCTREDIDSAILASAAANGITESKKGGAA